MESPHKTKNGTDFCPIFYFFVFYHKLYLFFPFLLLCNYSRPHLPPTTVPLQLTFDPVILLVGTYLRNAGTPIKMNVCTPMLSSAIYNSQELKTA